MPKVTADNIVSDTKWVKLVATRGNPHIQGRSWFLTIYISGVELEFRAVEGVATCLFTQQEALKRVQEFEAQMLAEGKDLIRGAIGNILDTFIPAQIHYSPSADAFRKE